MDDGGGRHAGGQYIPFLLDPDRGEFGTLVGHVARANKVWTSTSATESVVVFQGPESYITPSWYPTKHEHGKAVPTWNYVVVHAHGVLRMIEDPEWLRQHEGDLTHRHEAGRETPWHVSAAPSEFIDALLGGIVGLEIPIARSFGRNERAPGRDAGPPLSARGDCHCKCACPVGDGPLQIQEQRVSASARQLHELRQTLAGMERQTIEREAQLADLEGVLPSTTDSAERQAITPEVGQLRALLAAGASGLQKLRADEGELANLVSAEQGRLAALNQQLDAIDQAMRPQ